MIERIEALAREANAILSRTIEHPEIPNLKRGAVFVKKIREHILEEVGKMPGF